MKIVIDIPQGLKNDFENENWTALSCMEMKDALMDGTPLPQGHGDLIDKAKLLDEMFDKCGTECCCCEHFIINKKGCRDDCGLIFNAPTIIEADEAESEEVEE